MLGGDQIELRVYLDHVRNIVPEWLGLGVGLDVFRVRGFLCADGEAKEGSCKTQREDAPSSSGRNGNSSSTAGPNTCPVKPPHPHPRSDLLSWPPR